MNKFRFQDAKKFTPVALGPSLCMDFDAVVSSFSENSKIRVKGALSSYIYDMPQYPGDSVNGGVHYSQYVRLPTSLIPQKQPSLLKEFAPIARKYIGSGASFFDLGPGPEWSVERNTIPSLKVLNPSAYFAVDIELDFTEEACKTVAREFPGMVVKSIAVDFHREALPCPESGTSVVWYPGSTLGNLPSSPRQTFADNDFVANHLKLLRSKKAQRYLVLLMDNQKDDVDAMVNLYTSPAAKGCFMSILFKLRRDLQAEGFSPELFRYKPVWNDHSSAVEHVFTALQTQEFKITDCFTGRQADIKVLEGESYVLANSIKPSYTEMRGMLSRSGWQPLESMEDSQRQFHIHLARASINAGE